MKSMNPKFFGQFLLERKRITAEQLQDALTYKEQNTPKFGDIAIEKGFLTPVQVKKIHNAQKKINLRFGDLAVKMNVLTPDQFREIITHQKNRRIFIGQVFIEKGILDPNILAEEISRFKEEQSRIQSLPNQIQPVSNNYQYVNQFLDITRKYLKRIGNIDSKIGHLKIRHSFIETGYLTAWLSIRGSREGKTFLTMSPKPVFKLAETFYEAKVTDEDEAQDVVYEFLNTVMGHFATEMEKMGKIVEFDVPTLIKGVDQNKIVLAENEKVISAALVTTEGDCEAYLLLSDWHRGAD